jgi:hypothetical protein
VVAAAEIIYAPQLRPAGRAGLSPRFEPQSASQKADAAPQHG